MSSCSRFGAILRMQSRLRSVVAPMVSVRRCWQRDALCALVSAAAGEGAGSAECWLMQQPQLGQERVVEWQAELSQVGDVEVWGRLLLLPPEVEQVASKCSEALEPRQGRQNLSAV